MHLAAIAPLIQKHGNPPCTRDHERQDVKKKECWGIHAISPPSARLALKCSIKAPKSQAIVEIAVDKEMPNDSELLERDTAGAMKPAATHAVESLSSELARSFVRSLCTSVIHAS
ncbi:hypothetical protein [Aliirhizobium smilacinae]|uniref:Uncharacterized protein n=1 Tax=Aliirhizobium smilacinae TaxID=1395944 RepID=A0A5C4XFQ4_9HYPH|nr:hypothetical protein [Rhizobium smilacinae]TNM62257.1 hypothetical protein FHP24_19435 [Rhizobium smilacinae]